MESVVEGLSGALQQKGHTVQVATLRLLFATGAMAPAESVEAGLAVRRMRHWGPRRYPVAPAALGEIRGYDLVHIHAIDFFVDYLEPAALAASHPAGGKYARGVLPYPVGTRLAKRCTSGPSPASRWAEWGRWFA